MKTLLIEISPLSLATSTRTLIPIADGPSPDSYGVGGVAWQPALKKRPQGSIDLFSPDMDGTVQTGTMSFTLSLGNIRSVPNPQALYWMGAPVLIYSTDDYDLPSSDVEFVGTITGATLDLDALTLEIDATVSTAFITKPLLTKSFGGSGGLDGEPALRGKLLPAGYGYVQNIQPVFFDNTLNIGMIDGYGNCTAIPWLGEGLSSFGASQGDYPTYAALAAAITNKTVAPGQWATCIAYGLVGLGAPPTGVITCHAQFNDGKPGAMMLAWLAQIGLSQQVVDMASFNALDSACPYPVHYWTGTQVQVNDLMQQMAASCNASPIVNFQGQIGVYRAVLKTQADATLDRSGSVQPTPVHWAAIASDPPYYEIKARAARPASVLTIDQVNYVNAITDRGGYNSATTYSNGDLVYGPNGASYLYIYATPAAGIPLSDTAHWQLDAPAPIVDFATQVNGAGKPDLGATRNVPRGDYNPQTVYQYGDLVNYNGSVFQYTASTPTAGNTPPASGSNAYWSLFITGGDDSQALAEIAAIQSDSVLSRVEKKELVDRVNSIMSEYQDIIARGNQTQQNTTALTNAYNALMSFLNSLSPAWNDKTQDTPLPDNTTLLQKFGAYYSQRDALSTSIGANLTAQLANITSDNVISAGGEKGQLIQIVQAAHARHDTLNRQSAALGSTFGGDPTASQRSACDQADTNLQNYLNSLSPAWNDLTTSTPVDGPTLRNYFANLETTCATLDQANQSFLASQAGSALNEIITISSDGIISAGSEKGDLVRDVQAIHARHYQLNLASVALIQAFGGDPTSSQRTACDSDDTALQNYLNGLSPAWNDLTTNTPVDGPTLRMYFANLESSCAALDKANQSYAAGRTGSALNQIAAITSDNLISAGSEKNALINLIQALHAQHTDLNNQSATLGQTYGGDPTYNQRIASDNADTAIQNYLNGLSPAWNDVSQSTPIDGPTFRNLYTNATNANQALSTANAGYTAGKAQSASSDAAAAKQAASNANTLATQANAFSADVTDNSKFSKDEKKRYYQTVNNWVTQVPALVNYLSGTLGQTAIANNLNNAWQTFYSYLQSIGYADLTQSTSINRDTFRQYEQSYASALVAAQNAATTAVTTIATGAATNYWTDPQFLRVVNATDWGSAYGTGYTIESPTTGYNYADGSLIRFYQGSGSGDRGLNGPRNGIVQAGDRVDVSFDYYVDANAVGASFGIWVQGIDGNGNNVGDIYSLTMSIAGSPARNTWLRISGSFFVPNVVLLQARIQCQAMSGGFVAMRNPRTQRIIQAVANLSAAGRQSSALLTSAYAVGAGLQTTGLTLSGSNGTINISNFSIDFGDGYQSITGTTISGLGNQTYYVWLLAPNMSNTGRSFSVSTSFTGNSDRQRIILGAVNTSTGGSTGGGSIGGGGTNACVVEDMFILDGLRAGDADTGTPIELLAADWMDYEIGEVDSTGRGFVDCVELTTRKGVVLECSTTTPIELPSGYTLMADDCLDAVVAVMIDSKFGIDFVAAVRPIGKRWVSRIHVGGRIYAAGKYANRRLFTHNVSKP